MPPILIAKLSAICVGKKPFLRIAERAALTLLSAVDAILAISSALTSVFNPDLLCFKKSELNISAEDIDFSNKADERLNCDYQGDDMQIGFNSRFLSEMLTNLNSEDVQLEMSLPNRAGILTPVDGLDEGELITMLVMPVMLSN